MNSLQKALEHSQFLSFSGNKVIGVGLSIGADSGNLVESFNDIALINYSIFRRYVTLGLLLPNLSELIAGNRCKGFTQIYLSLTSPCDLRKKQKSG